MWNINRRFFRLIRCAPIFLVFAGSLVYGGDELFQRAQPPSTYANHTFVFWVNGDADHFALQDLSGRSGKLERVDKSDVARIEHAARICRSCNVVILHHQRGGARWYTFDKPWATYLRVFVKGERLLERRVPVLNPADPSTLISLLRFSSALFPRTALHLIYRGHSLVPAYDPSRASVDAVSPFSYGFTEWPYGVKQFAGSIRAAGVKLSTVVFAACRMASLEVASELSGLGRYMIASQVDILETIATGFDYRFLERVEAGDDNRVVSEKVASGLPARFDEVASERDAAWETPFSLIDLEKAQSIQDAWGSLKASMPRDRKPLTDAVVRTDISERVVRQLEAQGFSPSEVSRKISRRQVVSPRGQDYDVGILLSFLEAMPGPSEQLPLIQELREMIRGAVTLFHSPAHSRKSGISVELR